MASAFALRAQHSRSGVWIAEAELGRTLHDVPRTFRLASGDAVVWSLHVVAEEVFPWLPVGTTSQRLRPLGATQCDAATLSKCSKTGEEEARLTR